MGRRVGFPEGGGLLGRLLKYRKDWLTVFEFGLNYSVALIFADFSSLPGTPENRLLATAFGGMSRPQTRLWKWADLQPERLVSSLDLFRILLHLAFHP